MFLKDPVLWEKSSHCPI